MPISPHLLRFCLLLTCPDMGHPLRPWQTAKEIAGFPTACMRQRITRSPTLQQLVAEGVDLEARETGPYGPFKSAGCVASRWPGAGLDRVRCRSNAMDNQA